MNIFESKPELIELTRKVVGSISRRNQIKKMPFYLVLNRVISSMSKIIKYHELSQEDKNLFKLWIQTLVEETE